MARVRVVRSFARQPWPLLFALAGLGVVLSAHHGAQLAPLAFCDADTIWRLLASGWSDALGLAFALNTPGRLTAEWALMLLAMMPPLLATPVMHVWRSSLPRRRIRALAHFTAGYVCLWMMAAPILVGLAVLLQLAAGEGSLACALLLASLWTASPWQRAVLNRGHRLGRIGLFGWAADRDCLRFGTIHAAWCIASCWPWMVVPLVAGRWHLPTMMLASAVMLCERLATSDRPRWRLPAFLSLLDPRSVHTRPPNKAYQSHG